MTGRSTTGLICICAGDGISWLSQWQTSVHVSLKEAEIVLMVENELAISLAQNLQYLRPLSTFILYSHQTTL